MFKNFRPNLFKEKTKDELDLHFNNIELEKGDLLAMLIAALITFGPVIIIVSILYVLISFLFI